MNIKKLHEIITGDKYSLNYDTEDLFQLRKIEAGLYVFAGFKSVKNIPFEIQKSAGNMLFRYCKEHFIVIGTNDKDKDMPIINFLEDSGFKIKYKKVIYTKDLSEHSFEYEDNFTYISLKEIGLDKFMKVFEQTVDIGIERDAEPLEFFNQLIEYAGKKYDPEQYKTVILNGKQIGVIMPQIYENEIELGTVFHFGVIPGERNKGYGRILHSKSLEILRNQGAKKYIGSTNIENKPMVRLFELSGCKVSFKRIFYQAG